MKNTSGPPGEARAMRLARIVMHQCEAVRRLEADDYLGTSFSSCPARISHVVVSKRRVIHVSKPCDDCVLAKLYRATHVVGQPKIRQDGRIEFIVRLNRRAERVLREHRDEIVEVEEIDYRSLYLTPRQRQALEAVAEGGAYGVTSLARALGVSKSSASRLYKRILRKLILRA